MKYFCCAFVIVVGFSIGIMWLFLAQYLFINGPDWLTAANVPNKSTNEVSNTILILSVILAEIGTIITGAVAVSAITEK